VSHLWSLLGFVAMHSAENLEVTERCFEEQVRVEAAIHGTPTGSSCQELGQTALELGHVDSAVRWLGEAAKRFEADRALGEARDACGSLGNAYARKGDSSAALEAFSRGIELAQSTGDRAGEGRLLEACGLTLEREGRAGEAITALEQALAIHEEVGDDAGIEKVQAALARLRAPPGPPA
jgi:tetratricopeptide (TPR) repeat protein